MGARKFDTADERQQVRTVAERWRRQYQRDGQWTSAVGGKAAEIHAGLLALDVETARAEDVAQIIGNGSWVRIPSCEGCGKVTREALGLGECDYEDQEHWLCVGCWRDALKMFDHPARSAVEG